MRRPGVIPHLLALIIATAASGASIEVRGDGPAAAIARRAAEEYARTRRGGGGGIEELINRVGESLVREGWGRGTIVGRADTLDGAVAYTILLEEVGPLASDPVDVGAGGRAAGSHAGRLGASSIGGGPGRVCPGGAGSGSPFRLGPDPGGRHGGRRLLRSRAAGKRTGASSPRPDLRRTRVDARRIPRARQRSEARGSDSTQPARAGARQARADRAVHAHRGPLAPGCRRGEGVGRLQADAGASRTV